MPTDDRQKVLVVDDVPSNIRMLGEALRADYEVMAAASGEKALELVAESRPDLILLDIVMPGIDGYEVLRRLKEDPATQDIPVIFVTGLGDADDEQRGLEMGAVDYISKPFFIPIVMARVRTQLQLKRKSDILESMVMLDALTEIPNRRHFDETLDVEWKRARRAGSPLAVAMMDIDHFKAYNDNYGHAQGDDCLRRVAKALEGASRRPADFVARYGGEEFVAVLPETPHEAAMEVAERLRAAVEAAGLPHAHSRMADHVTVSVGLASIAPDRFNNFSSAHDLLKKADEQLYVSKQGGRNRVSGVEL